jgi:arabinofuranan 3-O-arabinosyltransferase
MTVFRTRPDSDRAVRDMRAADEGASREGSAVIRRIRDALPDGYPATSGRWFLLIWLVALAVLVANHPGRMFYDTKLGVDIDPAEFYARLWPLWNPLEWFGTLQDQYIGYAFPMAFFYLAAQALHVPVWIAERVWLSLLIGVGFSGLVRLATALKIGSERSRLVAGLVFVLWPTFTIIIGSTSVAALPGLIAPWAVLPLVAASRRGSAAGTATGSAAGTATGSAAETGTGSATTSSAARSSVVRAAALSGAAVLCMGGVNAVVTLDALILPALFIVTHTRGRRRVTLASCWALAVAVATSWWTVPLLLQGRYSFNFLPYIEQAATTTATMSAAAFLRGAGNWTAYFNLGTPWLSAGWAVITTPVAVLASAIAAATGLAGVARRDMPEAWWLRLSIGVAALGAMAGYGGPLSGPLHSQIDQLLDGALAPFRNVYKFEPVIALVLALGLAHALARIPEKVLGVPGWLPRLTSGSVLAAVAALVLAGLAWPYLSGQILNPGSFTQIPGYWYQVADYLGSHSPREPALVVPADSHGTYLWGDPIDEPLEPLAQSPWVERGLVPYGGAGSQIFLETAESAIESGEDVAGLPAYLERAGVRYVVVRNDLDPRMVGYTSPQLVHETLALSGFRRVAAFGPLITGKQTDPQAPAAVQNVTPGYPAVEVYAAKDSGQRTAPATALPVGQTVLVDGGPDSLLQLEGQNILGNRPAVMAGDPLVGPPQEWAVTDGLRRADNAFGLINSSVSYTYTATETNPVDDALGGGGGPPRQILPAAQAKFQTVAVLSGAAQVTSSSAGSWLAETGQYDPVNAFDGNPATAWEEGDPNGPVGQWIQIRFDHAVHLSGNIGIQLLDDGSARPEASRLEVSTAAGRVSTDVRSGNGTQRLGVARGSTTWLRVTISAARGGSAGGPGAGFRDVLIPGVHVTSFLRPAEDRAGVSAPALAFSFQQQIPSPATLANAAAYPPLARAFVTPQAGLFKVSATAVALPGSALDALLAQLTPAGKHTLRVTASSTFGSLPSLAVSNLFNGTGPWIAGGANPVIQVSWHGDRRIAAMKLTPAAGFAAEPESVKITSPGGTRVAKVGAGGAVTITPPLTTDRMDISFPASSAAGGGSASASRLPVGLSRLSIPALAGLRAPAPDSSSSFSLPCGKGPGLTVDGHTYPTAVSGTLGDLTRFLPVQVRLCTTAAMLLLQGRHSLVAALPGPFTITNISLTAGQAATASQAATAGSAPAAPGQTAGGSRPRALKVLSWQPDNRTMRIGRGPASYVEVHQNANPGWTATLNGRKLPAVQLDGWQQAFVAPAGSGGVITMTFVPATLYHLCLIASVLAIVCLLAVAFGWKRWPAYLLLLAYLIEIGWALLHKAGRGTALWIPLEFLAVLAIAVLALTVARFRRGPAPNSWKAARKRARDAVAALEADSAPAGRRRRAAGRSAAVRRWIGPVLVAVLVFIVGGPLVLAVPVLAALTYLWPRRLPALAFVGMLAAGIITALAAAPAALGSGAFGAPAQACALVALAAALIPPKGSRTPADDGHEGAADPPSATSPPGSWMTGPHESRRHV